MNSLDQVILGEFNPFDLVSFLSGNFWAQGADSGFSAVESIHAEAFEKISETLKLVAKDHHTRSILLTGDSGCGKTYLLSRLKTKLNSEAFFAYIDMSVCPSVEHIWRHTLRYTVDSLMHTPAGEKESQLLLWLKSLSVFQDKSLVKKLFGEKTLFINQLKKTYPIGIYQAKDFFGVLYELTKPEKYAVACNWLRGENLDEEDLKALGVTISINSEEATQGILGNFGRIADATKPIVLCFEQVESFHNKLDGSLNLSIIFGINTAFHNNYFKNFLVIITISVDNLRQNEKNIPLSDRARIEAIVKLKQLALEQVKALWETRLKPIHLQLNPKPLSPIAPLDSQILEKEYPGGKANLRDSLTFGSRLYQEYKLGLTDVETKRDLLAAFKLLWLDEFKKTQKNVTHLRQFSSPELAKILQEIVKLFDCKIIKSQLLPSPTYASYSFSYTVPNLRSRFGILWMEDPNLKSFFHAMKASQKALQLKLCDKLILLRNESCGNLNHESNKLYSLICSNTHIKVSLESLHYLKTYQKLATDAEVGDLVIGFEPINLATLQQLILESKVLENCSLLRQLGIITSETDGDPVPQQPQPSPEKEYILNVVKTQQILAKNVLVINAKANFSNLPLADLDRLILELCSENLLKLLNPQGKPEEQLICLVPQ